MSKNQHDYSCNCKSYLRDNQRLRGFERNLSGGGSGCPQKGKQNSGGDPF
jgi:hypothetical protein